MVRGRGDVAQAPVCGNNSRASIMEWSAGAARSGRPTERYEHGYQVFRATFVGDCPVGRGPDGRRCAGQEGWRRWRRRRRGRRWRRGGRGGGGGGGGRG